MAVRLQVDSWAWRYSTRKKWAVTNATFTIEPGERVLLLGASGSGKSTLLHAFAGVLADDEGESLGTMSVDGASVASQRGRVGLVLQDPDTQAVLSRVGDDVAFGMENLGVAREEMQPRVDAALDAVGLDVDLDRSTAALSGGQKQRLALAGVLAMQPGAILLDEPTANLDPAGVREVRDAVLRTVDRTGATLGIVEHRTEVWLDIVTRVIVLGPDGVIADGSPTAVLRERGAELAAAGVWVPGHPPQHPAPAAHARGGVLLEAAGLQVARVKKHPVAGPIDLSVHAGEVIGIVGPNGAGKSTLGLTLAGLIPAHAGSVRASDELAGMAQQDPFRWTSRQLLTRIGTVLQEPEHQLIARTVRDEIAVGPRALGLAEDEVSARVDELMGRLRLSHVAGANPYTLSGGEQRRLTVGAMLATRPRVLVLDEPTFGQDAVTWSELVGLMAMLRDAGHALVVVTHDAEVSRALHARRVEVTG